MKPRGKRGFFIGSGNQNVSYRIIPTKNPAYAGLIALVVLRNKHTAFYGVSRHRSNTTCTTQTEILHLTKQKLHYETNHYRLRLAGAYCLQ